MWQQILLSALLIPHPFPLVALLLCGFFVAPVEPEHLPSCLDIVEAKRNAKSKTNILVMLTLHDL